jgi:UDP-glucose 4-epimerase
MAILFTWGAGYIGSHTCVELLNLGWIAKKGINEMCEGAWRWQNKNPNG